MKKGDTIICIKKFTHLTYYPGPGSNGFLSGIHTTITIFNVNDTTKIKSRKRIDNVIWYHLENYDQRLISENNLKEYFISLKDQRKLKLKKLYEIKNRN